MWQRRTKKSGMKVNHSSQWIQRKRNKSFGRCWLFVLVGLITSFVLLLSRLSFRRISAEMSTRSTSRCDTLSHLSIHDIESLTELDLANCNLNHLPETIRFATNLVKLDVSFNPLITLPSELEHCTKLDTLFVSNCPGIKDSLPPVLGKMNSITRLGWKSGSLTNLDDHPESIPPNLVHFILTHNKIQSIRNIQVFKRLSKVRKLMLSHNQMKMLNGQGLLHLHELELLRLGGNIGLISDGNSLPHELWNLPKLKWLTLPMGNEQRKNITSTSQVPKIALSLLQPRGTANNNILGQGASGKVTAYSWNGQQVAVKRIRGVTSDGTAEDELAMYATLGSVDMETHRVVGCLALFYDGNCFQGNDGSLELPKSVGLTTSLHKHSNSMECNRGIVMKRLPDNLVDLALPPTIVEVTRDRYENRMFTSSFVYNVLKDIASALTYLHEHAGIAHGDLYAHNIKVDEDGRAFLLDLGASYSFSLYPQFREDAKRFEMQAFCVLSQELISRVNGTFGSYSTLFPSMLEECKNHLESMNLDELFNT